MNGRFINNINSKKAALHPQNGTKMELEGRKWQPATCRESMANRRRTAREKKLALLHDVENLKKRLRQEENVHRALQRAFSRPLGALPRLPPYLPQYTLELLAEVAVLEEEVVRLEKQVMNFRQGLCQEAVYISSRKSPEHSIRSTDDLSIASSKRRHTRSSSQSEVNSGSSGMRPSPPSVSRIASARKLLSVNKVANDVRHCSDILPYRKQPQKEKAFELENGLERENQSRANSDKDNKVSEEKKSLVICSPVNMHQLKPELIIKNANSPKMQCRTAEQAQDSSSGSSNDRLLDAESEANKMSQDILNCLISIFLRLSKSKAKTMDLESLSSLAANAINENNEELNFRDPYCISSDLKKRDIATHKHLHVIETHSVDLNRKTNASFLIRRLRILLDKLASLKLDGLSHQQKLAFWINIYNSCIMNAYLEHGIPDRPDMIVIQMQKATIKVGGYLLNALTIEHLILRLPYHLKYTCSKSAKNDERMICRALGLEWSEPLVTFALSCGSWSSPAVRVYTASQVESQLETAKKDYLQAAVGISASNKLVIPKLLDWYLLDFAKDLDALLEWVCLQLPDELRNEAVKCLERKDEEPLSTLLQVMPYNFSFRYLVYR